MRKSSLIICSLITALSLSACSNKSEMMLEETIQVPEGNSIVSTTVPDIIEETDEDDTARWCTFTPYKATNLKAYLENYTYISVKQTIQNGAKDEDAYSSITYDVTADVVSKIAELSISKEVDGEQDFSAQYIRDFANDSTFEKSGEDWVECDGTIMMIDWDIMNFENDYSVWQYLMKDNDLPVNTSGYTSESFEYYTVTKDASENMLSGIKYDRLGKQETTFIFKEADSISIPISVIVEVNYFVGDKEYYVRSTLNQISLGNTKLSMPELKEEETSTEQETNVG